MFSNSWIPVAIYMSATMLISFIATRMSPETLNRDLTDPEDAAHGKSGIIAVTSEAQHVQ
ncbi:hypothetical protein AHiyo8_64140 [Arthrobacter sp. Hiyo8]|nr:hypothetical protein AHiyo8_64140 [Arthrobacter sp. Hiyo8]